MYRFFIKEEQIHDGMIEIMGSDVNHIKNVLRMKTGDKFKGTVPSPDAVPLPQ